MTLTVKLVEPPQVIEQRLQRLRHGQQLQEAMDDDVEHRKEAQTHVTEVDGQVLRLQLNGRVDLLRQTFEVQLLWILLQGTTVEERVTNKSIITSPIPHTQTATSQSVNN